MTTWTRYVGPDGALIAKPGAYDIVDTVVHVLSTRKSNGVAVDEQDATVTHTLTPRGDSVPESDPVDHVTVEEALRARAEKAEQTIAALVERFTATFQPDFGGVDWRDDQAIQDFARDFIRITHTNATTPASAG